MFGKNNRNLKLTIVFILSLLLGTATSAIADSEALPTIAEDDLSTTGGLPWGGRNWTYSEPVEIQDGLVGTPVGKVVFDRHGVDKSNTSLLFKRPFSAIRPGKSVFITLWGSKIEGCFAEMIVQIAPKEEIPPETITPTLLELGIGGQILQIQPQQDASFRSYEYTYTEDKSERRAIWYMVRQLFPVDGAVAAVLSNAEPQDIKARVNFGDNSLIVPLGEETVKSWKDAYAFNPSCQAL